MLCDLPSTYTCCGLQWQYFQPILPKGKTPLQWGTVSTLSSKLLVGKYQACLVGLLCSLQRWLVDLCSSCKDPMLSVIWVPDIAFTSATAKLQLADPPSTTPRYVWRYLGPTRLWCKTDQLSFLYSCSLQLKLSVDEITVQQIEGKTITFPLEEQKLLRILKHQVGSIIGY